MLMKTNYEKTIDSSDDMLASEKRLLIWRGNSLYDRMASDPRLKIRDLVKKCILYNAKADTTQPGRPAGIDWVVKG